MVSIPRAVRSRSNACARRSLANAREDGVWFDSRAWIVKARRP